MNLIRVSIRGLDEMDGDLTDESRPSRRSVPVFTSLRPQVPVQKSKIEDLFYTQESPKVLITRNQAKQVAPLGQSLARQNTNIGKVDVSPRDNRFGKSFKFEHEITRPGPMSGVTSGQIGSRLQALKPGKLHGFVFTRGNEADQSSQTRPLAGNREQQLRQSIQELSRREDADDDDDDDDDDYSSGGQAKRGRGNHMAASAPTAEDADGAEDPDADPEYNPRESHVPAHTKPKRFEKSFAYVHRDLPKKGAPNPDDFVVSYGRGNVQTEQENYDSDKDNGPAQEEDRARRRAAAAAAAAASHRRETHLPVAAPHRRARAAASISNRTSALQTRYRPSP